MHNKLFNGSKIDIQSNYIFWQLLTSRSDSGSQPKMSVFSQKISYISSEVDFSQKLTIENRLKLGEGVGLGDLKSKLSSIKVVSGKNLFRGKMCIIFGILISLLFHILHAAKYALVFL